MKTVFCDVKDCLFIDKGECKKAIVKLNEEGRCAYMLLERGPEDGASSTNIIK